MVSERDAIRDLQRLIDDDHPWVQDALVEALGHELRRVRIYAALQLAEQFQDVRAVAGLAEALETGDQQQRKAASAALWEVGDADTPGMLRALYLTPADARDTIARALYWIGWSPDDPDTAVAFYVTTQQWRECIVLGASAVPGLLSTLQDWDGTVRRGAAWVLGEIGDERAVPALAALLSDTQGGLFGVGERVCDIAAEALTKIGTPEALAALAAWQGLGG